MFGRETCTNEKDLTKIEDETEMKEYRTVGQSKGTDRTQDYELLGLRGQKG